ncbi:MAG: hypothetical protein ABF289_02640 [Clostridiales bacterium]
MLESGELDRIYQDTCGIDYEGNVHMYIRKLEKLVKREYRYKGYCMHLDEHIDFEDVRKLGFNVVEVERKIVKLSNDFSGALRTFAYFMASGTHFMIEDIDYLDLYGENPSVIETAYAIYVNVMKLDDEGNVLNAKYAEKRATDYIRSFYDSDFIIEQPLEDWERTLYSPPPLHDSI